LPIEIHNLVAVKDFISSLIVRKFHQTVYPFGETKGIVDFLGVDGRVKAEDLFQLGIGDRLVAKWGSIVSGIRLLS
jgi:hypothetical protein